MDFTIKRSEWLRGEEDDWNVFLYRNADKKKCCLGILGEACGIPLENMANVYTPESLSDANKLIFPQAYFMYADDKF